MKDKSKTLCNEAIDLALGIGLTNLPDDKFDRLVQAIESIQECLNETACDLDDLKQQRLELMASSVLSEGGV